MQVFYGHLCLSEVICMYVYGILKTNTNMKFHTCDVVVGSGGCLMYIRGWVSYLALIRVSLFIYFIFIYITASPLRGVILRTPFIFSLCLAWFFVHQKSNVILTQALYNVVLNYRLSIFVK